MKKLLVFPLLAAIGAGCSALSTDVSTDYAPVPKRKSSSAARYNYAAEAASPASPAADRAVLNSASGSYFKAEAGRQMAYNAGFTLSVKARSVTMENVKKLAESLGGYLISSQSNGNMTIKIPLQKADEFLKSAGKAGKLRNFYINAEDLTDTITDLNVRLDNLKKFRTRLTELLAKTNKVEEILKIERELNRITTESERLTAQLQNNRNRVNFVTFEVLVVEESGALPGGNPAAISNFPFLQQLGDADIAGNEKKPLFDLDIPAGFVSVKQGKLMAQDIFVATSSDDCIFRTWEVNIPAESNLKFWEQMICRALEIFNGYGNIKVEAVTLDGEAAVKISADATTNNGILNYAVIIAVERNWLCSDKLRIVEFFGPEAAFKKHQQTVLK